MPIQSRLKSSQGELFYPPAKLPDLPPEVHRGMLHLLVRMMREHLQKGSRSSEQAGVGDE
jgi:hypothetical protein